MALAAALNLTTRLDNISNKHLLKAHMGGLKEDIKNDIFLKQPEMLMKLCNLFVIIKPRIRLHASLPLEPRNKLEIDLFFIEQPYPNQPKYQ
jgi:hypothetical protein